MAVNPAVLQCETAIHNRVRAPWVSPVTAKRAVLKFSLTHFRVLFERAEKLGMEVGFSSGFPTLDPRSSRTLHPGLGWPAGSVVGKGKTSKQLRVLKSLHPRKNSQKGNYLQQVSTVYSML